MNGKLIAAISCIGTRPEVSSLIRKIRPGITLPSKCPQFPSGRLVSASGSDFAPWASFSKKVLDVKSWGRYCVSV